MEDMFRDVTKLNCLVIPSKAEPGIEVTVIVEAPNNNDATSDTLGESYRMTHIRLTH